MHVEVVDFTESDAPEAFARSLRDTGFAVVVNHPLQWEMVEQIHREWGELFDSPQVEKYGPDPEGRVGWFPSHIAETAKGETVRDLKEFFHVYDWSVYPDEVTDTALRYRTAATEIARTLLGWVEAQTPPEVAAGFNCPLASMLDGSRQTLLRILRYPPVSGGEPVGAVRAAAHEDINLLTVLPASNQPGLQLKGSNGEWYPVPCDPGSLAVNAGEMLDLASGGHYPATTHRVVTPVGPEAQRTRMALPLFLHPADDVVLAKGRTAASFLAERIAELRGGG